MTLSSELPVQPVSDKGYYFSLPGFEKCIIKCVRGESGQFAGHRHQQEYGQVQGHNVCHQLHRVYPADSAACNLFLYPSDMELEHSLHDRQEIPTWNLNTLSMTGRKFSFMRSMSSGL